MQINPNQTKPNQPTGYKIKLNIKSNLPLPTPPQNLHPPNLPLHIPQSPLPLRPTLPAPNNPHLIPPLQRPRRPHPQLRHIPRLVLLRLRQRIKPTLQRDQRSRRLRVRDGQIIQGGESRGGFGERGGIGEDDRGEILRGEGFGRGAGGCWADEVGEGVVCLFCILSFAVSLFYLSGCRGCWCCWCCL